VLVVYFKIFILFIFLVELLLRFAFLYGPCFPNYIINITSVLLFLLWLFIAVK